MSDVQHIYLSGHAAGDGELINAKSKDEKKKFGVFTIGVNRYLGKEKGSEATFYDCICFGPQREKVAERIKKGDRLIVYGRPTVDAYKDRNQNPVGKIKVVVDSWTAVK